MQAPQTTDTVCPVCTLYLRPGITLKQHLASHPKQKVIEALCKISIPDDVPKPQTSQAQNNESIPGSVPGSIPGNIPGNIPQTPPQVPQISPYMNTVAVGPSGMALPGNHFFMYQQSMSTSSPHQSNPPAMPMNPFAQQQYFVPAVYNPQMMPYFYQQQQLIMASNAMPPNVRALPFEMPPPTQQVANPPVPPRSPESTPDLNCTKEKETPLNTPQQHREEIVVMFDVDEKQEQEEVHAEEVAVVDDTPNTENIKTSIEEDPIFIDEKEEDEDVLQEDDPISIDEHADSDYKSDPDEERPDSSFSHSSDHDYQPDVDHNSENEEYSINLAEDDVGTSMSHHSNAQWPFSHDLNKACQTNSGVHLSPRSISHQEESTILSQARQEYFYVDQRSNMSTAYTSEELPTSYEQSEPIYTSANIINNTDGMEFMTMDELEGMQVIIGEFSNSPLIPQPETFERGSSDSPPILMTIGGVQVVPPRQANQQNENKIDILENKILVNHMEDNCLDNVNIRSDEKMPARGELSGQESMGSSSDVTWNQIQHFQDGAVGSYEQNSWDSVEVIDHYDEENMDVNVKKEFSTVDVEALKEELKADGSILKKEKRPVGLDINTKKVKKLVIKPKKPKKETQTNFDNVFSSRLKVEDNEEMVDDVGLDTKEEIKEEPRVPAINECKDCNLLFKTKKELRDHDKNHHKPVRIKATKCQICEEVFDMEHKFNDHLKVHPLECRMCGKLFYRRQGLKLHTARHLGIKPFKCELCSKAFLVKQKLEEHRNSHTGNTPIKCAMCPETFKRHSNLVQHRNKYHYMIKKKIKDYICFCGEVFHSKKKLAWHKEVHDAKPKACTQCSEKFIHMASLTRHMRRAHNAEYLPDDRNPANSNAECPICKGVYLKTSMDAHMKTHTNQKPFSCSICNKEFTTKWNLKLHKWTHASRTQKPFKCELCKGAFIRENDYISHMNSHKSLRPYTCNYCGAQFIRKYNCQRHVKEHENEKTYNCTVCGKTFHRSYYLKDHMRVHSGVRPYSCHICGKTSTTKSNHNKHVQIHHAREPVSTEN